MPVKFFSTNQHPQPMIELHLAAVSGDLEEVRELLEKGADVNAKDEEGRTPLHWAAGNGYVEVARLLIEHGADVNAKESRYGDTPLDLAAYQGHWKVMWLLGSASRPVG